jgi:hypothetical protein
VHANDTFCGFCGQSLRVQCSACGRWTQENYTVCPTCGTVLHGAGLSFAQKHELETLQRTLADLEHCYKESNRHLLVARRNERHSIYRLLVVGMLAGALLLILEAIVSSGLSLPGLFLLLFILLLFRPLIPAVPALGTYIYRWCAPGDLALWREEQRTEHTRLAELVQERTATARAIADLQALTAAHAREADELEAAQQAERIVQVQRTLEKLPERAGRTTSPVRRIQAFQARGRRPSADRTPHIFRGNSSTPSPAAAGEPQTCIQEPEGAEQCMIEAEESVPL